MNHHSACGNRAQCLDTLQGCPTSRHWIRLAAASLRIDWFYEMPMPHTATSKARDDLPNMKIGAHRQACLTPRPQEPQPVRRLVTFLKRLEIFVRDSAGAAFDAT